MRQCNEVGDRIHQTIEFNCPTVKDLFNSPLSCFIHLATRDYSFTGTSNDLICNRIHPLFLNAHSEASKEFNPNWWQAMNGPFAKEYWKAACAEIKTLEDMETWDIIDCPDGINPIDSTWAFKCKRFPDGQIKKFKGHF